MKREPHERGKLIGEIIFLRGLLEDERRKKELWKAEADRLAKLAGRETALA